MDPWGARQVVTGLLLVVGSAVAATVLALGGRALSRGEIDVRNALGIAGAFVFLGVWWTFALRLHLTGIYVNDTGVRLRHVFSTLTLPWSQVTGFEARPALFLGGPTVRLACWVRTAGGAYESAVQRRSAVVGWRKNNGPVLTVADFDRMLAQLADQHTLRRRAEGQLDGGGAVSR